MSPRISDGDNVVIHESADIHNLNGNQCLPDTGWYHTQETAA
jgi:hypothetical protein